MNKYLEKVALMTELPRRFTKGLSKAWEETSGPTRLSLGLGTAGLGVSSANYITNQRRDARAAQQHDLEQKSLSALRGIHRALVQQSE